MSDLLEEPPAPTPLENQLTLAPARVVQTPASSSAISHNLATEHLKGNVDRNTMREILPSLSQKEQDKINLITSGSSKPTSTTPQPIQMKSPSVRNLRKAVLKKAEEKLVLATLNSQLSDLHEKLGEASLYSQEKINHITSSRENFEKAAQEELSGVWEGFQEELKKMGANQSFIDGMLKEAEDIASSFEPSAPAPAPAPEQALERFRNKSKEMGWDISKAKMPSGLTQEEHFKRSLSANPPAPVEIPKWDLSSEANKAMGRGMAQHALPAAGAAIGSVVGTPFVGGATGLGLGQLGNSMLGVNGWFKPEGMSEENYADLREQHGLDTSGLRRHADSIAERNRQMEGAAPVPAAPTPVTPAPAPAPAPAPPTQTTPAAPAPTAPVNPSQPHSLVQGIPNKFIGGGGGLLIGKLLANALGMDEGPMSFLLPALLAAGGYQFFPQLMDKWKDPYGVGSNAIPAGAAAMNRANPVIGAPTQ